MSDDMKWGRYAVVRVGNRRWGEWTNVGVIIFDADGNRLMHRMDEDGLARAAHRGDITEDAATNDILQAAYRSFPESFATVAEVERAHERISHAMSVIQIGELLGTVINEKTIDRLWDGVITPRYS